MWCWTEFCDWKKSKNQSNKLSRRFTGEFFLFDRGGQNKKNCGGTSKIENDLSDIFHFQINYLFFLGIWSCLQFSVYGLPPPELPRAGLTSWKKIQSRFFTFIAKNTFETHTLDNFCGCFNLFGDYDTFSFFWRDININLLIMTITQTTLQHTDW